MPDERLDQIAVLCVELTEGAEHESAVVAGFLARAAGGVQGAQAGAVFGEGEIPLTASATKVRDDELRRLVAARLEREASGAS